MLNFRKAIQIVILLVIIISSFAAVIYLIDDPSSQESYASINVGNTKISATPTSPTPTPDPYGKGYLLPDMQISPLKQLYINDENGIRKIRFDTEFKNIGKGPLELIGTPDPANGVTIATQVLYREDGVTEKVKVGEFVFHTGHDHWHVDRYAEFQLYTYDSDGNASDLIASTDKFSFCIWDEYPVDRTLENAPQVRQYPRCPENIQGNSVGWGDTYPAYIEGQELDITDIEDGSYLIISTINADRSLIESDYENNTTKMFVEINGYKINEDTSPKVKGWWIKRFFN
jgi:hypothetical protein